jgi:hypothetical protein
MITIMQKLMMNYDELFSKNKKQKKTKKLFHNYI